ncbi:unnamed protein product [Larinioides sclopetarius]|uniref:Uncharacterized protein n=1 Tax=Larinioides sclopetarius TaxID=280406 RepID=A0AAV2BK96_9ARAC
MKCLKCDNSCEYSNIRELVKRLKFVHNVQNGDKTKCIADGCGQYFNRVYNLILHHENFQDDDAITINSYAPDNNFVIPNEIVNFTVENSESSVELQDNININGLAFDFCSEIMNKNNMTYTSALSVVGLTSDLLKNATNFLGQSLQSSGINIPSVNNDLEKVKNMLKPFNSVFKFKHQFEKSEFLIKPVEIELGNRFEQRFVKGSVYQVQVKDTYQYVPIVTVLKALFNRHNIINEVLNYKNLVRQQDLSNIQDGQYYKAHKIFSSDNSAIALEFDIDDVDFNNPCPQTGSGIFYN